MSVPAPSPVPRHVAIIMDGNGRWARARHLPRTEGHRRGVEATQRAVRIAGELGIEVLTLYAFSAENWGRPEAEISALVDLLEHYLPRETPSLIENGIRLHIVGRTDPFPARTRALIDDALTRTAPGSRRHLAIALNYGSRQEILDAMRRWGADVAAGRERPADLTWDGLRSRLYTADLPDPDLVIRTSGEHRLSNFLLLQSAYAEWVFLPVLWPDFDRPHFEEALLLYAQRERRFGRTSDQVRPAVATV